MFVKVISRDSFIQPALNINFVLGITLDVEIYVREVTISRG